VLGARLKEFYCIILEYLCIVKHVNLTWISERLCDARNALICGFMNLCKGILCNAFVLSVSAIHLKSLGLVPVESYLVAGSGKLGRVL
jgi:hypothetical protein